MDAANAVQSLYHPLGVKKREIRLLWVDETVEEDERPQYNLLSVPMGDEHPYYALSYEWNPELDEKDLERYAPIPETILVNGEELRIRTNLLIFLKQFQVLYKELLEDDPDKPPLLWIDAVCINQADIQERK